LKILEKEDINRMMNISESLSPKEDSEDAEIQIMMMMKKMIFIITELREIRDKKI
jgi:hypothetical protein